MTARPRCTRGHFLPAAFSPPPTDPDDECRCVLKPRRRRRRHRYSSVDLHGQGLPPGARITTVPLTGRYL